MHGGNDDGVLGSEMVDVLDHVEEFDASEDVYKDPADVSIPVANEVEVDEDNRTTWERIMDGLMCRPPARARSVSLDGKGTVEWFPPNVVRNQKYSVITFFPVVLFEQFKQFANLYFLVIALSQLFPALQVGYMFTYVAPLAFVVSITMAKEAVDDYKRWKRDREANNEMYERIDPVDGSTRMSPASDIKVGHLIRLHTNQRVPTDMVLLRTSESSGGSFIRTDQLDGETDWKLRRAVQYTQKMTHDSEIQTLHAEVYAEKPKKDIYSFIGTLTVHCDPGVPPIVESLSLENTLWANTVVASGTVIGLTVYTGKETKSVINTSQPVSKVGILDDEVNFLAKLLGVLMALLALLMVAMNRFRGLWWLDLFRYIILFSAIIPISMRVNLDMAKLLYSYLIMSDEEIHGSVVRNTAIPEELGRISYLLTDKTGTLTQNDMVFKKLHIGSMSFSKEALDDIAVHLEESYHSSISAPGKVRKTVAGKVRRIISALALCHNVTPVEDDEPGSMGGIIYQASSPDEVALVKFTESVGLTLVNRTFTTMTLRNPVGEEEHFEILNVFPFTSETKRMGIVIRDRETGVITFLMKGADAVMSRIVQYSDWLEEECGNMAREGLRTLVFGYKVVSEDQYQRFAQALHDAKTSVVDREARVRGVIDSLEQDLELIGLSGVEDKLQENVQTTLEQLRHGGVKIWMLTGDKIETATCIAISSKLVARNQFMFQFVAANPEEAQAKLNEYAQLIDTALIIDGRSLQFCLDYYSEEFFAAAKHAPSVVCCRCSPTQKADVVELVKKYTGCRTCAIGDGGNDVSMIQAANVGIGIVGKEGQQASMAADVSVEQFSFISQLLLWHGRNSYQRSARLCQFIIHRGLIISFIQAVFSTIFFMAAVAIYTGWLLVGYSTWYTMAPVFALVLDEDVKKSDAFTFPELYQELQKGRALSMKTFFYWTLLSVYQAAVIMVLGILLFENNLLNIVSITFTALILSELINVAFTIRTWRLTIVLAEVITFVLYFVSMVLLPTYFDLAFISTWDFWWKVVFLTLCSCLPVYFTKLIVRKLNPPAWTKLRE